MLWADITTDFFARSYFSWIENVVGRAAVKKSVTLRVLQLLSVSLSGVLLNCWTVASPRAEVLDSRLAWYARLSFSGVYQLLDYQKVTSPRAGAICRLGYLCLRVESLHGSYLYV